MLDKKDMDILEAIKQNAKWTTNHISKKTLIPITTVHNRIKKLESMGIIKGYTAVIDQKKLGNGISAFIFANVAADNPVKRGEEILKELENFNEVHEAYSVTGEHDIIMRVSVKDTDALNSFIEKLNNVDGVDRAKTSVILKGNENHIDKTMSIPD